MVFGLIAIRPATIVHEIDVDPESEIEDAMV
jgi:hypothetical protein